ncbi:competence protein ComFC [Parageobacillus thermantarcticus]|uniref:Competence protein ComFC n=1 Tax=Parageobacillus thermantarcticus TaxID=186116 RepID=A0A1I0SYG7_9BACL|nr:ComF family protein [Parageobacillus thermantarcticus]SFA44433.1 competence protein ComFC [Parageobacillus thermantarcticus]
MNCLICHAPYNPLASWQHFLTLKNADCLCVKCRGAFVKIDGEICDICGRPFAGLERSHRQGKLCADCVQWQKDDEWKDVLTKNRSVYMYNEFMKEVVALWKFRGDYAIVQAFQDEFCREFYRHFDNTFCIVPIPLSDERLYERGFNQAKALAELLALPIYEPLCRRHLEKQSKKSRLERLRTENVFRLSEKTSLRGKHIVLIDDIYTTGTTLRHAAKVLLKAGAASVSSITLARG